MENNFNFEIFETPEISEQETEKKQSEKAAKKAKNKKKNTAIKILGTIAIVIIAVIAVLCIYLFTAPSHNPQKLAAKYVDEINSGKWEKAYSRLYFENSTAVDKEAFINYCNENPQNVSFTDSKIIDYDIEKDTEDSYGPKSSRIFYSVNYILEDGTSGTLYLTVEKTNSHHGKLAEYGILPNLKCFASLKISVPPTAAININGIEFNDPVTENQSCIYEIKYNLAQTTDIQIYSPFFKDMNETLELKSGTSEYSFSPEITEECYNNLCRQTEESITSIYNDIIEGNEDFSKYKLSDSYRENGFGNDIESIKKNVFMGNYAVSDFKVEEVSLKKSFEDIEKHLSGENENIIDVKYDFRYSYTVTYEDADGQSISQTREGDGYFGMKFVLGNEWYINDISTNAWF